MKEYSTIPWPDSDCLVTLSPLCNIQLMETVFWSYGRTTCPKAESRNPQAQKGERPGEVWPLQAARFAN
jgi:hypothetical protein